MMREVGMACSDRSWIAVDIEMGDLLERRFVATDVKSMMYVEQLKELLMHLGSTVSTPSTASLTIGMNYKH